MVPADPDRPRTGSSRPQPTSAPPDQGAPAVDRTGPRFRSSPRGPGERPPLYPPPQPIRFPVVRNGYDQSMVDRQTADLSHRLVAAEEQRLDATRRLAAERQRAEQIERELREAKAALQAAQQSGAQEAERGTGFGYRAERILRLAEAEARDMRAGATSEAAALLERTHSDAEARRHEMEQALISRSAELDQEAAQRSAQLDAREQKLAEDVEAARAAAAHLRETAQREVAEARQEAEAAIQRAAAEAEQAATRRREATTTEIDRLTAVHDKMREELTRLHRLITTALPAEPGSAEPAEEEPVSAGRT